MLTYNVVFFLHCIDNSHTYNILFSMHIYFCDVCIGLYRVSLNSVSFYCVSHFSIFRFVSLYSFHFVSLRCVSFRSLLYFVAFRNKQRTCFKYDIHYLASKEIKYLKTLRIIYYDENPVASHANK
jgi:hypothetical protein